VTDDLEHYRYSEAMRQLYDFAWDEFCSFYVEMSKTRLYDEQQKNAAQAMLVKVLYALIRLLHPVIPFVTEEIYQRLKSGICNDSGISHYPESIAIAEFPAADESAINPEIEKQFAVFQEVLRAVRDVRSSRNILPKTEVSFSIRCDEATAKLLDPMKPYFASMAKAKYEGSIGQGMNKTENSPLTATIPLTGMDVFVDLSGFIDVKTEIAKLEKEIAKLDGFIKTKEAKLNSDFVDKAPANVVEGERKSLTDLQMQRTSAAEALTKLKEVKQ